MFDRKSFPETYAATKESCRRWLESNRTSGKPEGFYRYSKSAFHSWTLYGSNSALAVHQQFGTEWTPGQRKAWAAIFLDHYHPELGLFLCPVLYGSEFRGDPRNPADRRRADGAAPFKKLAAKIFDLTGEIVGTPDDGTLGHEDTGSLRVYFDECRQRQHPYAFGSTIGDFMHKRTLWLRGRKLDLNSDPWLKWAYEYIQEVRDPRTGLITGNSEDPMLQMDGLFKLACSAWWNHDRPVPAARKAIDSILALGNPEKGFGQACEDYNATLLLSKLSRQEQMYRFEDILSVITGVVYDRLEARRKPDGAFSFHVEHCITRINMYDIAPALPESDLLGTGQQLTVLGAIAGLIGGPDAA